MDFSLNIEESMLRDSARQFLSSHLPFEARQRSLEADTPDDAWERFAELGWLAMPVPEAADGLDSRPVELALMCEELGRGLCVQPFIAAAVLPARMLRPAWGEGCTALLSALATGERRVGVALYEPGSRFSLDSDATVLVEQPDGSFRLRGRKILVGGGDVADTFLVVASQSGAKGTPKVLCRVPADSSGVDRSSYRGLDDQGVADVAFDDVALSSADVLASGDALCGALDRAIDEAVIYQCADAVGAMSRALELAVEYLHIRRQFGKELAEFQSLQHAAADLFIDVSDARSILYHALGAIEAPAVERRKATSACKIKVIEAAKHVAGTAVHLHGGIGVTTEYPVGHCLRRVMVAERLYGDREHHLQRYLAASPN